MKTLNLTLAALLLLGAPVLLAADEDMPKDRSVWDRIGENDVRVVGEVTYVYDDSFELRTPDEVMTFPIPDQDGVMAALEPGERIQVWYDPADLATGSTARVTYIERFELMPEGMSDDAESALEEIESETEEIVDEIESETAEAWNEAEAAIEPAESSAAELPQTATSVPSRALAGLVLLALGALVWGRSRS